MTDSSAVFLPRAATIDGFAATAAAAGGISLRDIEPLSTLLVETRNSHYRIVVAQQTAVYVQGGRFFPETTPARLDGSSVGGSFLKMGWIGIGLCMEIWAGGQRIVTSPVRAITRESDPRSH